MLPRVAKQWIRDASDELAVKEGCFFDESKGRRVLSFLGDFCKQSKGEWGGSPLSPLPWQEDWTLRLYGWRRPDGRRRFTRSHVEIPKKNGKSTWLAGKNCYWILADGEPAPEIYLCAVDRKQAGIVYEESKRMVAQSPELDRRLMVVASKKEIHDPKGYGKIQACSADAPSLDGPSASHIVFDELHRQKNRDLWSVMEYASAARRSPLWVNITTAGDEDGLWSEQRDYSERVASGEIPDTTHLGIVYRAPEDADIDDPAVWRAANPSMGHTIDEERFGRELERAKLNPLEFQNFLRLRLGIRMASFAGFCDKPTWMGLARSPDLREMAGRDCYLGLDLSGTTDLTALVFLFPDDDGGFDLFVRFWLPDAHIEEKEKRDRQPYRIWAREGILTLCPGGEIDFGDVEAAILEASERFHLVKLGGDPWQCRGTLQRMEAAGIECREVRQGMASLAYPTAQLDGAIRGGRLRHDGNPCLAWCVSNAVAESDVNKNIRLTKKKSRGRIDGAAATVNALAAWTDQQGDDDGETPGIILL